MCSLDADERIRINVIDYDFGMWDVSGFFVHVELFSNLLLYVPRYQKLNEFCVCSIAPSRKQTVATILSGMSRSVSECPRQSDLLLFAHILWRASSSAVA